MIRHYLVKGILLLTGVPREKFVVLIVNDLVRNQVRDSPASLLLWVASLNRLLLQPLSPDCTEAASMPYMYAIPARCTEVQCTCRSPLPAGFLHSPVQGAERAIAALLPSPPSVIASRPIGSYGVEINNIYSELGPC